MKGRSRAKGFRQDELDLLVEQYLFRKQQQKMLFHDKQQASDTYETNFTHFSKHRKKKFTLGLFEKPLKNRRTNSLEQESVVHEK
jgi:hypothetical protein